MRWETNLCLWKKCQFIYFFLISHYRSFSAVYKANMYEQVDFYKVSHY